MLAHILALFVGFGSFVLYMSAFFFPEVHRKYDFTWSGIGLFYALVLWVCAGRITGGVLLGQTASVALLGWLGWQTLSLRRALTPVEQQTQLAGSAKSVPDLLQTRLKQIQTTFPQRLKALPLPGGFRRVLESVLSAITAANGWVQGLIQTTFKPQKRSPRKGQPSPTKPQATKPTVRPASVKPVEYLEYTDSLTGAVETVETERFEPVEVVQDPITTQASDDLEPLNLETDAIATDPSETAAAADGVSRPVSRVPTRRSSGLNKLQERITTLFKAATNRLRGTGKPTRSPVSTVSSSPPVSGFDDDEFDDAIADLEETMNAIAVDTEASAAAIADSTFLDDSASLDDTATEAIEGRFPEPEEETLEVTPDIEQSLETTSDELNDALTPETAPSLAPDLLADQEESVETRDDLNGPEQRSAGDEGAQDHQNGAIASDKPLES